MVKFLLFDWGNTIMVDFNLPGPMYSWERTAWVEGAEDALNALGRYTCCIATNAGSSNTDAVRKGLARVGADRYFPILFSSWDIGFGKPDPRFFRFVVEQLGTVPENCVMIGDNYEKDIVGAKATGMRTILFNPLNLEGEFPDADAVILKMHELPEIVEKL